MKTLEPLEPSRKAFRLIGGILVERTVEEVLPAVKKNADQVLRRLTEREREERRGREGERMGRRQSIHPHLEHN
jgi:prefoldin subunit 2